MYCKPLERSHKSESKVVDIRVESSLTHLGRMMYGLESRALPRAERKKGRKQSLSVRPSHTCGQRSTATLPFSFMKVFLQSKYHRYKRGSALSNATPNRGYLPRSTVSNISPRPGAVTAIPSAESPHDKIGKDSRKT